MGSTAWNRIPYTTAGTANDRNSNYPYTADDFGNNKGDICKYIGLKGGPQGYRMAKSIEFAPGGQYIAEWTYDSPYTGIGWIRLGSTFWGTVIDAFHPGGTLSITNGGSYQSYPFPASEFRFSTDGLLADVGTNGSYWSGSTLGDTYSYRLYFYDNYITPGSNNHRQFGFAVRCVLQE
jgi:hypothetical protein